MDILSDFIATRCTRGHDAYCPTGKLYEEYEVWCKDNGEDAVKKRTFSILLKERGFGDDVKTIADRKQRIKVGLALPYQEGGAHSELRPKERTGRKERNSKVSS